MKEPLFRFRVLWEAWELSFLFGEFFRELRTWYGVTLDSVDKSLSVRAEDIEATGDKAADKEKLEE